MKQNCLFHIAQSPYRQSLCQLQSKKSKLKAGKGQRVIDWLDEFDRVSAKGDGKHYVVVHVLGRGM